MPRPDRKRRLARSRRALSISLLVLLGCGQGADESAAIKASVEAPSPRTGRLAILVQVATLGAAADSVRIDVKPAKLQATLAYSPAAGGFAGSLVLPAGMQTLTATAFAGKRVIGDIGASILIVDSSPSSLYLRIIDPHSRWPLPTSVAITTLAVAPAETRVGSAVSLAASAAESSGRKVAYLWSSTCAGPFRSTTSPTTSWTPASSGTCGVTIRASSLGALDSRAATVEVQPQVGTAGVTATFLPWPLVSAVGIGAPGETCWLLRSGPDATCRAPVAPGSTVAIEMSVDVGEGATAGVLDSCAGTVALTAGSPDSGHCTYAWSVPVLAEPTVCILTSWLELAGMRDTFSVDVAVVP
jgi:hypothetical protein